MNLQEAAKRFDRAVTAMFPGWAASRSDARLSASKADYLATAYDSARATMQRRPQSRLTMSENGSLTELDLDAIREMSRNAWRNNSIFSGICRRWADNVIGDELMLEPMSKDPAYNADVKAGFREWTRRRGGWETSGRWCLGQFQRAAAFGVVRCGDLLMYRSDDGWQWFEGGQMGTPAGYNQNQERIISGISLGPGDRPLRYWVSDYSRYGYIDVRTAKGLRADLCNHVLNYEWISQFRGVPLFQSLLGKFEDFDRYTEAHLLGAMARACVVGEFNSPKAGAAAAMDVRPIGEQKKDSSTNPKPRQLAPAMMLETFTGEKFTMHSPNVQGGEFSEYFRGHVRLFGMPLGMPLELTFMDFSQTNFAAAKMAVMQHGKTASFWRHAVVVDQITAPVYLDYVRNVHPKTNARPVDAEKFEVIPPEQDWIQPEQEVNALNKGIEGGIDTRTRVAREEMRRNYTDMMRENAQEIVDAIAICKEKGLDPEKYLNQVRGQIAAAKAPVVEQSSGPHDEPVK